MSEESKPRPFAWTKTRETAAFLVADDRLKDEEIAAKVGVTGRQLDRWKVHPEFAERVREHVAAWKAEIRRRGLAIKERRVESLIRDFEATEVIVQERGKQLDQELLPDDERSAYAGGARTGFIARDWKGKDATAPVYQFDAALMRERRELRRQIAVELGDWVERRDLEAEVTGKDGGPIRVSHEHDVSAALSEHLGALRAFRRSADPEPGTLVSGDSLPGSDGAPGPAEAEPGLA